MYNIFEHTADMGIEARGDSAGEALSEAARGLTAIVTNNPNRQDGDVPIQFRLEAPDKESLVVAFLAELLWLQESKDLLWTVGGVEMTYEGDSVVVTANGMGRKFHGSLAGVEVKAITYHGLEFFQKGKHWQLRVLLDI